MRFRYLCRMARKQISLLFLICVLAWSGPLVGQSTTELEAGYVVPNNGDTLRGFLKPVREDRPGRSVSFFQTPESDAQKFSPKTIKGFGFGETRFETGMVEDRMEFLRVDMAGAIHLLIFTERVKKGGGYTSVQRNFIRLEGSTRSFEITKGNFRKEMVIHVSEHPTLAQRIRDKALGYDDLGAIIEEYNEWVKAGKPRQAWEPENGNYTLNPKDDEAEFQRQAPAESQQEGGKWGIEMPLMASWGFLNSDQQIGFLRPTAPGTNLYAGLGMRYRISPEFLVRFGLNYAQKNFNVNFIVQDTAGVAYNAEEQWKLPMLSSYAMLEYQSGHFFLAGGLQVGVVPAPFGKIRITDGAGNEMANEALSLDPAATNSSFLFRSIPNQVDLIFSTGLVFYAKNWVFKPGLQYGIPLQNMFQFRNDLPLNPPNPSFPTYSARSFTFQVGLVIDFGL